MKLARRQQTRPVRFEDGDVVAGYAVVRFARPGSTGELVYDAETEDGQAVSLVASGSPEKRGDLTRFHRLARLRSETQHPGLLPVYDAGRHEGTRFLVTAPYPERTLSELLGRALPPETALSLLEPVAEALDVCHRLGLVHQNLTDESVLLDGDRTLLDGFAIVTRADHDTWDGLSARDLRYGTPETMRGVPLVPASNVYSLSALLVHLLTGEAPYEGRYDAPPDATAWAAGIVHTMEPPPKPSDRVPELGPKIDRVIAWGMAKEPERRPASATELLLSAAEALGFEPVRRPRPHTPPPPAALPVADSAREAEREPRLRGARLRRPAAILAAAALGLAAGAIAEPFADDATPAPRQASAQAAGTDLSERRVALRRELAGADTPDAQAFAARALAAVYRAAAGDVPQPLPARVRRAAEAYSQLASAAEAGDESAYADAAEAVAAAEQGLAR
jgi:serine/threonine-protein kinase